MILKSTGIKYAMWLCLVVVTFVLGHALFKKITGPSYEGHNMEWWLEFSNPSTPSKRMRSITKPIPDVYRHQMAIKAFQSFDDRGIEFLCEEAFRAGKTNIVLSSFQKALQSTPMFKRRDFLRERRNKSHQASALLTELGISYEQAQYLAQPKLESSDPFTRVSVTWIYHLVTNRFDSLANTIGPYLTHTNAYARYWAIETMKKVEPQHARPFFKDLIDPIHQTRYLPAYFHVLASFAPDSIEIQQYLISIKDTPDPFDSIKVYLALVRAFPDEATYSERLRERIKSMLQSKQQNCTDVLRDWPFSIEPVVPILIDYVKSSNKADRNLEIIRVLHKHRIDLTPVVPKLHSLLYFSPRETAWGSYSIGARDISAIAYLLEINKHDEKVWAYFEDLLGHMLPPFAERQDKTSKEYISLSKSRTAMLQLLAPHHEEAAALLQKLPLARMQLSEFNLNWPRTLLHRHHLIPLESKGTIP